MDEHQTDAAEAAQGALAPNVLRVILFVASQGSVPLDTLREFQAMLPDDEWGTARTPDGKYRLQRWLAWEERVRPERSQSSLGTILSDLVRGVAKRSDMVRAVEALLRESENPLLNQHVSMPIVDLLLRLSRGSAALKGLRAALAHCDEPEAIDRLSPVIDLEAARAALSEHLQATTRPQENTFEVRGDLPDFARRLTRLAGDRAERLSDLRLCVSFAVAPGEPVHRILVRSSRRKAELAKLLGVAASRLALERANFPDDDFLPVARAMASLHTAAVSRSSRRFA